MKDNANNQDQMTSENFSGDNREVAIRMHPQKLAMYISMLSMTMFFVALTSALCLRRAKIGSLLRHLLFFIIVLFW